MSDIDKKTHLAIIRGLQIFAEAGSWGVHAEHDTIHAGPDTVQALTEDQRHKLTDLGWLESDESWIIFT